MFKELPQRIEWLASQVVDIEYRIHKELGPGLLESVYVKCFCFELERRNIFFEVNKEVAILYQSVEIESCLRLDVLVENAIVIEFKAQENFHPVWQAQLLSYLKLTGKRLGFLINFHVTTMKEGIKRLIL